MADPAIVAEPLTAAQVGPMVAEAVKTAIADARAQSAADADRALAQTRANEAARQQQQQADAKPLRKVILDEIGGDLASMALESKSAVDFARFYGGNPRATRHQEAIEAKFNQLVVNGRPTDRDTIYKWMKGENFDVFVKEHQAEEAEAQARAAQGLSPVGLGTGVRMGTPVDPWAMTPDDLGKQLQGREF
jgi:hypothetical protein